MLEELDAVPRLLAGNVMALDERPDVASAEALVGVGQS